MKRKKGWGVGSNGSTEVDELFKHCKCLILLHSKMIDLSKHNFYGALLASKNNTKAVVLGTTDHLSFSIFSKRFQFFSNRNPYIIILIVFVVNLGGVN